MESEPVLHHFLEPHSVALIGVPRRTGRGSFNILEVVVNAGFRGRLYPVNPNADEIMGFKAYATVKALPETPDLAVMMLPRRVVPEALRDCAAKGVARAIIVSDGFAEADQEGKELQAELVKLGAAHGIRLIGPNSLGVVNNFNRFRSTFLPVPEARNPLALVSQSGGFFAGFAEYIPGKSIDLGNCCDVDFSDALEYLATDPEIKVIALHIEGLRQGERFLQTASRVNRLKPVLVLKTGKTEPARQVMASHTGSLTGSDQVYEAAFRQAGLTRVRDVLELGDLAKAHLHLPPFRGNRLALVTPTGGGAVMALDSMEANGFSLARLSPVTVNHLREFWSPWATPTNPIDMMSPGIMHGFKNMYRTSLQALLEDEGVDAVLCIAGTPTLKGVAETAAGYTKPVAAWAMGQWDGELLQRMEEVNFHAVFPSPERALRALAFRRQFTLSSSG